MAEPRKISDSEALDSIAEAFLGLDSYDNPSDTIESISMLVADTGREIKGLDGE